MPRQVKYPATLSVRMSDATWIELKAEATRRNVKPAVIVREALEEHFAPEATKQPWWRRRTKA